MSGEASGQWKPTRQTSEVSEDFGSLWDTHFGRSSNSRSSGQASWLGSIWVKQRSPPLLIAPKNTDEIPLNWDALLGEVTGMAFVDSTALAVCGNKRIGPNRVLPGPAEMNRTTIGWSFEFQGPLILRAGRYDSFASPLTRESLRLA